MRVDVTANDIIHGVANSCVSCPVALAVNRLGFSSLVTSRDVTLYRSDRDYLSLAAAGLPRQAREFIRYFDRGVAVWPFSFDLDVPEGLCAS